VHFEVADVASLPFKDNRFDVSCAPFALHDTPLPRRKFFAFQSEDNNGRSVSTSDRPWFKSRSSRKLILAGTVLFMFGLAISSSAPLVTRVQNVGNKICPVTGNQIVEDAKVAYEYGGKVYNFCCQGCIEPFKKNPEKYIKIIEEKK